MDSRVRKTWVGNMFQKLETVCHEFDNFVSRDAFHFVENHVQNVGGSVKAFCSAVVHDIPTAEAVSLKSSVDGEHQTTYSDLEQSFEEDRFDTTIKSHTSVLDVNHFTDPASCNRTEVANTCIPSRHEDDVFIKDGGIGVGKEIMEENTPLCEDFSFPKHIDLVNVGLFGKKLVKGDDYTDKYLEVDVGSDLGVCNKVIEDHEDLSSPKPTDFVNDMDASSPQREGTVTNCCTTSLDILHDYVDKGLEVAQGSDIGTNEKIMDKDLSLPEDLGSQKPMFLVKSSFYSMPREEKHINSNSACVSVESSVSDMGTSSSQDVETFNNIVLDEAECISDASSTLQLDSTIYCEKKLEKRPLLSSKSFWQTRSYHSSDSSHAKSHEEAETISCNPTDPLGSSSEVAGAISTTESFAVPAFVNDYLEKRFSLSCDSDGEEDDCGLDVADSSMQAIDLSDDVKDHESCVVVEDEPHYSFPCTRIKPRSYKKLIQEALNSRKRLTMEYKQLPILYGDIEFETSQYPERLNSPSIGQNSLELKKAPAQEILDSEWELL